MFKSLFFNRNNRTICKGSKESAAPVKEAYALPTEHTAKVIDRQEYQIRQLEKEAKNNSTLRFYMYGY